MLRKIEMMVHWVYLKCWIGQSHSMLYYETYTNSENEYRDNMEIRIEQNGVHQLKGVANANQKIDGNKKQT